MGQKMDSLYFFSPDQSLFLEISKPPFLSLSVCLYLTVCLSLERDLVLLSHREESKQNQVTELEAK